MFQKHETELDSKWTLGTVDQLPRGRDGLSRRVIIRYQNASENHHRLTDRGIRSVVKVWSCDDQNIDEDLQELQKRLESFPAGPAIIKQLLCNEQESTNHLALKSLNDLKIPCSTNHCMHAATSIPNQTLLNMLDRKSFEETNAYISFNHEKKFQDHDMLTEETNMEANPGCTCTLSSIITNLNLNLE